MNIKDKEKEQASIPAKPALKISKSPYWCPGEMCGDGYICDELMYNEGYCLHPDRRLKALGLLKEPKR